jgi:hypothetical protein
MPNPIVLLAYGVVVIGGLMITWPASKKSCQSGLLRFGGMLLGVVVPLVLLRPVPNDILDFLFLVCALVLTACAVTVAAVGWHALRHEGRKNTDVEVEFFNPFDVLPGSASQNAINGLDDLLFLIGLMLVIGLFWVGIVLGWAIQTYAMPAGQDAAARIMRVLLGLVYSAAVFLGAVLLSTLIQ